MAGPSSGRWRGRWRRATESSDRGRGARSTASMPRRSSGRGSRWASRCRCRSEMPPPDRLQAPPLVRPREVARAVTPLELFFDLVYVFTVSQLSLNLVEQVSGRGIAQTLVLALAVMYAWFMTVWTSNWLDVECS